MEKLARRAVLSVAAVCALLVAGCTGAAPRPDPATPTAPAVFDPHHVHTVAIDINPGDLTQQLETYATSGHKAWASAKVTIDGTEYPSAGIKLKGNLSLKGTNAESDPAQLSWLIRLDKYAKTQSADGYAGFIIRGNSTPTSLNEAVALDLLRDAGLASEYAAATRFSVNGGDAILRLMVQDLDDRWVADNFPSAGADSILYKSDADGDWSWRGDDASGVAYKDSFKVKAGPKDYAPLVELLDLLHHGTPAELAEKLPAMLNLDSFVTYQAFEHIIDNFDDISGPGNNSYLFYDTATKQFTVVAWDHNLAFATMPMPGGGAVGGGAASGGGAPGTGAPGGGLPGGFDPGVTSRPNPGTARGAGPFPPGAAGSFTIDSGFAACLKNPPNKEQTHKNIPRGMECMFRGEPNPLVDAIYANAEWAKRIDDAETSLTATLLTDGPLERSITHWTGLLTAHAAGLVSAAQISAHARPLRAYSR